MRRPKIGSMVSYAHHTGVLPAIILKVWNARQVDLKVFTYKEDVVVLEAMHSPTKVLGRWFWTE